MMREKLLELLNREGLRPSQLAEILEINPAGISHILAGRNKPSFELLQKILRRFPRINPDWLLLDSAQMYRTDATADSSPTDSSSDSNRMTASRMTGKEQGLFAMSEKKEHSNATSAADQSSASIIASMSTAVRTSGPHKACVQRIVIFYDDQTFETYTPVKE